MLSIYPLFEPMKIFHLEEAEVNRRSQADRRTNPTVAFSRYTLLGRRGRNRRQSDPQAGYIDWYDHKLLIVLCIVLLLSVVDGYLTIINVVYMGVAELNPIMACLLNKNIGAFFSVKYLLTGCGLIILCWHINFQYSRSTLLSILLIYLFVLCSHIYILSFSLLAS